MRTGSQLVKIELFKPHAHPAATGQRGQARHAQHQRHKLQPDQFIAQNQRRGFLHLFLLQPAQTPVAFHVALEFGIGCVGQLEITHGGQQLGRMRRKWRRLATQPGHQLSLIEQIDQAAQRRCHPGVAIHPQPFMHIGYNAHAHFARSLHPVQRSHTRIGQIATPAGIGKNHQFGNQQVQRRAALAPFDPDLAWLRRTAWQRGCRGCACCGCCTCRRPINFKTVIHAVLRLPGLATGLLQRSGQLPQHAQLVTKGKISAIPVCHIISQTVFIEQRLQLVESQIGHHINFFDAGFTLANLIIRRHVEIHRKCSRAAPGPQGVALNHVIGQHGDLAARHIHCGQPIARQLPERIIRTNHQRRRSNVNTDAPAATLALAFCRRRQRRDGKGIVDFRGLRIINAEGTHAGHLKRIQRQRRIRTARLRGLGIFTKACALRKILEQKTIQMIVMQRSQRATMRQQLHRRQPADRAGILESLGFQTVAIRLVEQLAQHGPQLFRQPTSLQLGAHVFDGQCLLAFFLLPGQRGLQDLWRRLAKTPAPLAMKINRRLMQTQQNRHSLHGIRRMADVFTSHVLESKLTLGADFPKKLDVDFSRQRLGTRQQLRSRRCRETQQYMSAFDLAATARGQLNLQRSIVVGQNDARLEGARLLKQDVHCIYRESGSGSAERGRIIPPARPRHAGSLMAPSSRPGQIARWPAQSDRRQCDTRRRG